MPEAAALIFIFIGQCCTKNVIVAVSVSISVLVLGAVLLAVVLSTALPPKLGQLLSLEEATNGVGIQRRDVKFLLDESGYIYSNGSVLRHVSLPALVDSMLIDLSQITYLGSAISVQSWDVSPDLSKVLVSTNFTKLWRRSGFSRFLVIDVASRSVSSVGLTSSSQHSSCIWSPVASILACSEDYNIIIQNFTAAADQAFPVTADGKEGTLIHGMQSWVYEEEVFEDATAMWWSPDGSSLAFISFNETEVPSFPLPLYGNVEKYPYQKQMGLKYPLAGFPNPRPSVAIFSLPSKTLTPMNILSDSVEYVNFVGFKNVSTLVIRVLDRVQQLEQIQLTDSSSGEITSLVVTQRVENGWVKCNPNPIIWISSDSFLTIRNNSNYYHIAHIDMSGAIRFLTSGSWDVLSLIGYNPKTNQVYAISNRSPMLLPGLTPRYSLYTSSQVSPMEKHVFVVPTSGGEPSRITSDTGTYNAFASSLCSWLVVDRLGPEVPSQSLFQSSVHTYKSISTLEGNDKLNQKLATYSLPKKEFLSIPVNGRVLNAYVLKPPNFSKNRRYPVLFNQYQGPYSQQVTQAFSAAYNEYLSSHLGICIIVIDGIGTGARGIEFEQATYRQLGILETSDQVAAMRYVAANLGFVDPSRMAVWGWSYGGFMVLNILSQSEKLLKTAISVAPVVDWRLYDSAYTERYMSTPELNPDGYNKTSILTRLPSIQTRFLMVHGLADDNVHFANSAEAALKMINLGLQFDTFYYPNNDHGINSNGARLHLNRYLLDYLKKNLL